MSVLERGAGWSTITRRPDKRPMPTVLDGNTGQIVEWVIPAQSIALQSAMGKVLCLGGWEFARIRVVLRGSVVSNNVVDEAYAYIREVVAEIIEREAHSISGDEYPRREVPDPPVPIYCMSLEIDYGLTLSKPDKAYGKVDVSVCRPIGDDESVESCIIVIQDWLRERIAEETVRLKGPTVRDDMGF